MKKEELIERHGKDAYVKKTERSRQWGLKNPDRIRALQARAGRKGGKYYLRKLNYNNSCIQRERNKVRNKHRRRWREYKKVIAPDSEIHHAWREGTSEYDGLALVEKNAHHQGIIDVIQILDGEITLFTEKEIREQNNQKVFI